MQQTLVINLHLDELKDLIKDSVQDLILKATKENEKPPNNDFIKIDEVCKILGVSKVTVHAWKKTGLIPFYRISNKIFFKRGEILDLPKSPKTRPLSFK